MQFKHPEILYALFLLIIPILIHLFHLRKFEKVAFTNVQFLKKIELKTRKSSKLKKILVLMSRLLLFTALIFAFAQPFFSEISTNQEQHTHIYLDNSLSMQVKGKQGELFKRGVQDIIEATPNSANFSLYTHTNKWSNLNSQDLKNTLLSLSYHPVEKSFNSIELDIRKNLNKDKNTANTVFLISDFQDANDSFNSISLDSITNYNFIQLRPSSKENITIDSLYISNRNSETIGLKIGLKNYGSEVAALPISLYDENVLLGKSTVDISKNGEKEIEFKIPFQKNINGRVTIQNDNLTFDNNFYFTINQTDKINVLSIGEDTNYLKKIYSNDEFNYKSSKLKQLDYNSISQQNLIVLNEIETIPTTLIDNLADAIKQGLNAVIIPNENSDINSYNRLLSALNIGAMDVKNDNELQITDIHFSQPFYENVFEKPVENFQYPKVNTYYKTTLTNNSRLLSFENKTPFLTQIKKAASTIYMFSSAINNSNSNFKNSPLVVPIFYNFGKYSYEISQPAYTIGNTNQIEIKASLQKDDILEIKNSESTFIPAQQVGNSSVKITMNNMPLENGIYAVRNKENTIKNIAFNYNRRESELTYVDIKNKFPKASNIHHFESIKQAFERSNDAKKTNTLWQFFLGLSLLFLILEVLLLKFFKP